AEAAAGDAAVAGAAVADAVVGDAVVGDAAAACDELLHPPSARQSAGTIAISNVTGTRDLDIGILSWADCIRGTIAPHPATLERMLIAASMRPYSRWNWLLACVTTPSVGAAGRVNRSRRRERRLCATHPSTSCAQRPDQRRRGVLTSPTRSAAGNARPGNIRSTRRIATGPPDD